MGGSYFAEELCQQKRAIDCIKFAGRHIDHSADLLNRFGAFLITAGEEFLHNFPLF